MSLLSLIGKIFRRNAPRQKRVDETQRAVNPRAKRSRASVGRSSTTSPGHLPSTDQAQHRRPESARAARRRKRVKSKPWVPVGEPVRLQGRSLPDGMVYVGSSLRGVSPYAPTDPALINPRLPVDNKSPDVDGREMGYWPSYSEITPSSRAAYLDWLAAGRPGGANIGYVFLFFYGIERRVLFDIGEFRQGNEEVQALIAEVDRLLNLYQHNSSFNRYASEFLALVKFLMPDFRYKDLDPPRVKPGWDLPFELKIGLGSIVASGDPLPASWALSWLRLHPDTSLRTAARRCEREFDDLFRLRYHETYGPGMIVRRNKTPLSFSYRPASSSFDALVTVQADQLPDVGRLSKPVRQLQQLAESVTDELDRYSRWVGRHGEGDSLGAIAVLPRELVGQRQSEELQVLREKIDLALDGDETATILTSDLTDGFPSRRPETLSAKEAAAFAGLLDALGIGLVPDMRYSKVNFSSHRCVALFRNADRDSRPTDRFLAATVLLQLGAAVGAADGTVTAAEERLLATHLELALELSRADRSRLRAHLRWLLEEPPKLNRMRSRIRLLDESDRSLVARFVVSVAGADGSVSSDEIKVLTRIYKLIGLETEQLHRDIHEVSAGPSTQPVTVIRPDESSAYKVPTPPQAYVSKADRVELDPERIAEIMKSTREVSDLLTEIFEESTEREASESDDSGDEPDEEIPAETASIAGLLDPAQTELVQILAQRQNWTRGEFEQVATQIGLMPSGAIEVINDIAFQCCDEPLLEGEEVLEVNEFALKELLSGA